MASFFERLKRGMGVEIAEGKLEKPEKTEEKSKGNFQAAPDFKKKGVKKINKFDSAPSGAKIKIGAEPIQTKTKEPEDEELELESELEEKRETEEVKTKRPFFKKNARKEEKSEGNRPGFNLQNLSREEGQLAVDVYQTDSELVIQSTIAGVKPEELDISIEADTVLIKGNRSEPLEALEKNYFYQECYWGPFSRQIILPEETDPSRATAEMKEGVLIIRIPKIERKRKRKIMIKG